MPLAGAESAPLREDFESSDPLARWNLHLPQWAPTQVVAEPGSVNHALELRDEEPCEYALAERIFPSSRHVNLHFRIQPYQVPHGAVLEIEVQSQRNQRPMGLRFNDGWFSYDHGRRTAEQIRINPRRWYDVELDLDCAKQTYALKFDGAKVEDAVPFTERTE